MARTTRVLTTHGLSEGDLRNEAERRRASRVPEVAGPEYDGGHVDFTHRGYGLYREVIRAIHGDEFLMRCDSGFNLDLDAGRFDVYGVSAAACQTLMDQVPAGGER